MRDKYQTFLKVAVVVSFFLAPALVSAATLFISPESGTYSEGQTFPVRVRVSSPQSINAVSGELRFDSSIFSVVSVSKSNSILNFWVTEPNFSNSLGKVSFEGVALGGFQDGTGTVLNLNLKAIKSGSGRIEFVSGQVLANDGQGTNVIQGMSGAGFTIEVAKEPVKPEKTIVETPVPTTPAELKAPEIVLVEKYGERAISGTSSYPKAEVVMTFVNEIGVKVFILGDTDDNGQFLLLIPKTLKRGIYKIAAQVVQRDSGHSTLSNEIEITVGSIISDIGMEARIAFILLLVSLMYLLFRVHEHVSKMKKIRYEVGEVKDVVKKSFKILEDDIRDSVGRERNSENRAKMKEVMNDLVEAEELIIKEVKDVEKL